MHDPKVSHFGKMDYLGVPNFALFYSLPIIDSVCALFQYILLGQKFVYFIGRMKKNGKVLHYGVMQCNKIRHYNFNERKNFSSVKIFPEIPM